MEKLQRIILTVMAVLLAGVILTCTIASANRQRETTTFTPPPFDANAVSGVPENIPSYANYKELTIKEHFKIAMASSIKIEDGNAKVFFTSVESNTAWLKVVLHTEEGKIIGESGLLKSGEHIENIEVHGLPKEYREVIVKILSYEPETYYSQGTATIKVALASEK